MFTGNLAPPIDSAAPELPPRRDWLDVTVRLATSWIGLFTAYAVAAVLLLKNYTELSQGLKSTGMPLWIGVAVLCAFPLAALVFSTIPALIERRRIERYSAITGTIQSGYFTLRPREDEEHFERADNAHQEILRWLENSQEPVLYLTGASGTGKSSLLSAWVIPKLKRENRVVIQVRGYRDDLLARIRDTVLEPGVVWDKPPAVTDDLRSLFDRVTQRLGARRLLIVVDQFEEFLILKSEDEQNAFRQLLSGTPIGGLSFLLVYRPEYEALIQGQAWPRLQLETNRRVVPPFTESSAQEFMRKSGLTLNPDLLRMVLREAAEIEQTAGLIRPVTLNMCGLVLSRFANGLPRRFRGGVIRGFLRESLSLPEVRDAADKLIPALITDNLTKRPGRIDDLVQSTQLAPSAVRACVRRLGESDRAIVRPLDELQDTWEISHDFLVPLLDSIVARRTVSWWRRCRPWLPWAATAGIGIIAVAISLIGRQDPRTALIARGWAFSTAEGGVLHVGKEGPISSDDLSYLRRLPPPVWLTVGEGDMTDVSPLRELKNLTALDLERTQVSDISPLRELTSLTHLRLPPTRVDLSFLRELDKLTELGVTGTDVANLSTLRELKNLKILTLAVKGVTDLSFLRELGKLTELNLSSLTSYDTVDVSPLRELKNLKVLTIVGLGVRDVSPVRELKNLTTLHLWVGDTDTSYLRELKNLTNLDLSMVFVKDISPLRELKNLTNLNIEGAYAADLSPLAELTNLTTLNLSKTGAKDLSPLRELKNLTTLDLSFTKVTDISPLQELTNLRTLDLSNTPVTDLSPLRELKHLTVKR